jgi:hypothetical protein
MDILAFSNELRGFELKEVILSPKLWAALSLPAPLNWKVAQVARTPAARIPKDKKGVYSFVVQPGIANHPQCSVLLYVGKAAGAGGFRARYTKYLSEKTKIDSDRPLVNRMIRSWFDHLWFCYAELPDVHIVKAEDELIRAYLPPINSTFPGDISGPRRAF